MGLMRFPCIAVALLSAVMQIGETLIVYGPKETRDWSEPFENLDKDGDGNITTDEMKELMRARANVDDIPDGLMELIMEITDKNGDHMINYWDELIDQEEQCRKLVRKFDTDGNGKLSPEESQQMVTQLSSGTSPGEVLQILFATQQDAFIQQNEDADGKLTLQELEEYLRTVGLYGEVTGFMTKMMMKVIDKDGDKMANRYEIVALDVNERDANEMATIIFEFADADGDDRMTKEEAIQYYEKLGYENNEEIVNHIFGRADTNGDNELTREDFIKILS